MRQAVALILLAGLLMASCADDAFTGISSSTTQETTTTTEGATSTTQETTTTTEGATSTTQETTTTAESTTTTQTTTTTAPPPGAYAVGEVDTCVIGSVPGGGINVRAGAGSGFELVGVLEEDATGIHATGWARRDASGDEWRQIEFGDGAAWVFSEFLTTGECTVGPAVDYCTTTAACADVPNVRTGIGTSYPVVATLPRNAGGVSGTGATALDGRDRTWVQVRHAGHLGWVAGWLLDAAPCSPTSCFPPALPWTITASGLGPILIGGSIADLEYLTGLTWAWQEPGAAGCLWGSTGSIDVHLQAGDGLVTDHILIYEAGAGVTAEGIRVGSTRTALNTAYGARVLDFGPAGYGDYAARVDLDGNGTADMLAVFQNSGLSTPIDNIRLPAVFIEGGCL